MAKVPVKALLNYCEKAADLGGKVETVYYSGIVGGKNRYGYVYGGQGETYSKELAEKWKKEGRPVPSSRSRSTYFTVDCARWYGRTVVDCSGMIVEAMRTVIPKYGDRTANKFIQTSCSKTGGISTIPEVPGVVVLKSGHIGVYVGGGYVIEARGTEYGVVKSKLSTQKWAKWGYLKDVDYGDADADAWIVSRLLKRTSPMMRGDDVEELQKRIMAAGIKVVEVRGIRKTLSADGIFGDTTESAVKAYQKAKVLAVDGKAGKNTITALGGVWRG